MHQYIEFFGLPGAGKTTLLEQLQNAGIPVAPPIQPSGAPVIYQICRLAILLAARHPIVSARWLSRRDAWWLLAKLGYRRQAIRQRTDPQATIIADGGVIQPLVSYLAEYSAPGATIPLAALKPLLPSAAALVYIRVPAEIAYRRYADRQTATGRRPGVEAFEASFAKAYDLCEEIAATWGVGNGMVFTVNGEDTAAATEQFAQDFEALANRILAA